MLARYSTYKLMQVCTCTLYLYFLGALSCALDESNFLKINGYVLDFFDVFNLWGFLVKIMIA